MTGVDFVAAMEAYWKIHRGMHSLMRCPGEGCPGGCGMNARDQLAAIHDVRRGKGGADAKRLVSDVFYLATGKRRGL